MKHSSNDCRKAYLKTGHRLWATNQQLHKITKKDKRKTNQDHRCNHCNRLHEDWNHVLRCPSSDSKDHQQSSLQTLRKSLSELELAPPMITLLISGITQWINNKSVQCPFDAPSPTDLIASLHIRAFYDQLTIGWDQLLCGRLANSWFTAHTEYALQPHLPKQYQSVIIGPKLVQACWQFTLNLWYGRNTFIHGTNTTRLSRQTVLFNQKITQAYQHKSLLQNSEDIDLLFQRSLHDMVKLTDEWKLNWLLLYNSCLHAPTLESNVPTTKSSLHDFFQPFQSQYYKTPESHVSTDENLFIAPTNQTTPETSA
eukprot:CAMPEP_0178906298 /NCGR_PEP_ID=MMETSP0786-20121207/6744_1 /TAXON_ID=186022 /ORGANISM="Thalassionema frauenfeldii, Strain CCMP 1798" /LENGTH=311 /DNA_ID=CAMNT_0020577983 /DNA_START=478 /DNA_END=1413 /DNA_ORIENTATION=-